MTTFQTGAGVVTLTQVVALSAAGVVFLALVLANLAVCRLYRRATTGHVREAKKQQRKQSDVWVYHVYRTKPTNVNPETASVQILRKLRASHDNLTAAIEAAEDKAKSGNTLGHEECQALAELEATTDLFLHDTSQTSSRPSSARSSTRHSHDLSVDLDLEPSALRADLDVGDFSDLDKVSVSSVHLADFENNPREMFGEGGRRDGGRGREGKRRCKMKRSDGTEDNSLPQVLPVAEFHNEAFDFTHETTMAAVECVKDVEL